MTNNFDIGPIPATKDLKDASRGVALTIFGAVFGGIPLVMVVNAIIGWKEFESIGILFFLVPFLLIFVIIGAAVLISGLKQSTIRGTIRITSSEVAYDMSSLFGEKHWVEPIERYAGILKKEEIRSKGTGNSSTTYTIYILELHHSDSDKCISLYESTSLSEWRYRWEEFARDLNIPAIEETDEQIVSRNVDDLDKSVRELVSEGKVDINFDPSRKPPECVDLRMEGDQLILTFKKDKSSAVVLLVIFTLICSGLIYVGFFCYVPAFECKPVWLGIVSIIFEMLVIFIFTMFWVYHRQLHLSAEKAHQAWLTPWGEREGASIAASSIEQVIIKNGVVLVISDSRTMGAGPRLSPEDSEWLKNCILTVISSSTEKGH